MANATGWSLRKDDADRSATTRALGCGCIDRRRPGWNWNGPMEVGYRTEGSGAGPQIPRAPLVRQLRRGSCKLASSGFELLIGFTHQHSGFGLAREVLPVAKGLRQLG
jgi:hypothetical protein